MALSNKLKKWLYGGAAAAAFVLFVETGVPLAAELSAIRAYQRFASPAVGYFVSCRFELTCSHFAVNALESEGFWKGNLAVAHRLVLCSPVGAFLDLISSSK